MRTKAKGMTLVEAVVIIVVLAIVVSLAIPVYRSIMRPEKSELVRRTLDEVRAQIYLWHQKTGNWPTFKELTTPGVVLGARIAPNPFFAEKLEATGQADAVTETNAARGTVSQGNGWAYNPKTGDFWANSSASVDRENTL